MSEAHMETEETVAEGLQPVEPADSPEPSAELIGGDDFWSRVTSDPDFASEQIRKRDAKTSQMANRIKELEPFAQLMEVAGGAENVQQHLTTLARIQQMPELAEIVHRSLTEGRVALPQAKQDVAPEEDEWVDPDVKAAVAPLQSKIQKLEEQLNGAIQQLQSTDLRTKERNVEQNITGALSMFEAHPEALEEAKSILEREITATHSRAESGDSQQAALYRQIADKGGQKILEGVLFDTYRKWAPKLVAASKPTEPNADRVLDRATDPRPMNASSPGQAQMPPKPVGKVGLNHVLESLRAAGRQQGIDTTRL